MKDPKAEPTGSSASDPAAVKPESTPSDAEYQFPTRKARRIAELTGMIPIVVPEKPSTNGDAKASTDDGGTREGAGVTDTSVPDKAAAAREKRELAADVEANSALVEGSEEPEDIPATRAPVAAASVNGLPGFGGSAAGAKPVAAAAPVVPVPPGPVAAIPAMAGESKKPARTPKAGRDLPAAISVGVSLLVLVVGSMLFFPLAFVAVASAFAAVGVWEVTRAMAGRGIHAPLTPVMVGALAMPAAAYFAGPEGLMFALVASCGATLLWRSLDSGPGAVKSILAGIFTLLWIPFLLSFVFLMLQAEQPPTLGLTPDLGDINTGVIQLIIMLLLVVANDTFGYLVGVLFGKHPMAPKISPKKSWEGFAGSLGGAAIVGILATVFFLDAPWWLGLVLAVGMVVAGTGGDFAESMVKRELGVKDMSNLLPGHGGVMDRLDSILFAAPVAYATFSILGRFQ